VVRIVQACAKSVSEHVSILFVCLCFLASYIDCSGKMLSRVIFCILGLQNEINLPRTRMCQGQEHEPAENKNLTQMQIRQQWDFFQPDRPENVAALLTAARERTVSVFLLHLRIYFLRHLRHPVAGVRGLNSPIRRKFRLVRSRLSMPCARVTTKAVSGTQGWHFLASLLSVYDLGHPS
jgi:hypothetical protein